MAIDQAAGYWAVLTLSGFPEFDNNSLAGALSWDEEKTGFLTVRVPHVVAPSTHHRDIPEFKILVAHDRVTLIFPCSEEQATRAAEEIRFTPLPLQIMIADKVRNAIMLEEIAAERKLIDAETIDQSAREAPDVQF